MSPRRAVSLALCLPVLALGVAACGDDEGGSGKELTASEYRSKLKAICQDGNKQTEALKEPTSAEAKQIKDFLERGESIAKAQTEKLKDLNPPSSLQKGHDQAVSYNEDTIDLLDEVVGKIKDDASPADLQKAVQPLQEQADELKKRGDAAADAVGVPACKDA